MRRVVVTGLGMVSPLGCGVQHVWDRILKGESGIKEIESFDVSDLKTRIAGQVPRGDAPGNLNADSHVPPKEQRKICDFILYALMAAKEAVEDAGWNPQDEESQDRTGVVIGSGIGGLPGIYDNSVALNTQGPRRVSPFFIPSTLVNLAAGHVSIRHGFRGPNNATVTACAAGSHAIGDASRLIQFGDADVMIAGGAEAAVCRIGISGFASARALSTQYNDTPQEASRPWDQGRDGFVMGEGAGILVLEELEHAKARGAKIYAEILGYGLSGDAHHITAPAEDGSGAYRAMQGALRTANLSPDAIDYINAHGTSTPLGDAVEVRAVKRLFGDKPKAAMSSTKSAIGHLLGAAGGVEAIFTTKALNSGIMPPTLNLHEQLEEAEGLDLVPNKAKEKPMKVVMSNSFGFGGTNASLIFGTHS